MYPPSGFPIGNAGLRYGGLPRSLALVAASVAFVAYQLIFQVFAPGPVRIELGGTPVPSCPRFGGKQPNTLCQVIHPDPRLPLRIGIALVALTVVAWLAVASYRAARRHPLPA